MKVKPNYSWGERSKGRDVADAVEDVANGSDYDRGALEEVAAGHRSLASLVGRFLQTLHHKHSYHLIPL